MIYKLGNASHVFLDGKRYKYNMDKKRIIEVAL